MLTKIALETSTEVKKCNYWANVKQDIDRRFLESDPLYQALIVDDRERILSEDLEELAKGTFLNTKDVTELINECDWMKGRGVVLSDAMLRNWFNMGLGIEEYIVPDRSGRNRSYDIDAVIRLKLLSMWRYVKKCSLQKIRGMVFGVPHTVLANRTGVDDNARITALEQYVLQLQSMIEECTTSNREMLELRAKLVLTDEAHQKWLEMRNRQLQRLFELISFEDMDAYRKFTAQYVKEHMKGKIEQIKLKDSSQKPSQR